VSAGLSDQKLNALEGAASARNSRDRDDCEMQAEVSSSGDSVCRLTRTGERIFSYHASPLLPISSFSSAMMVIR